MGRYELQQLGCAWGIIEKINNILNQKINNKNLKVILSILQNSSFLLCLRSIYLTLRNHLMLIGVDSLLRLYKGGIKWWGQEYFYTIFVVIIPLYFMFISWKTIENKKIRHRSIPAYIVVIIMLSVTVLWTQFVYVINTGMDSL